MSTTNISITINTGVNRATVAVDELPKLYEMNNFPINQIVELKFAAWNVGNGTQANPHQIIINPTNLPKNNQLRILGRVSFGTHVAQNKFKVVLRRKDNFNVINNNGVTITAPGGATTFFAVENPPPAPLKEFQFRIEIDPPAGGFPAGIEFIAIVYFYHPGDNTSPDPLHLMQLEGKFEN